MINIALRFDDPSETSDRKLEERIISIAEDYVVPITIAVIPFRRIDGGLVALSRSRAAHLVAAERAGIVEVAQHGYCHEPTQPNMNPRSEFKGRDATTQIQLIRDGRSALETIFQKSLVGFVPPWSTYDAATTFALNELRFNYLSAGIACDPASSPDLRYLPATCQMLQLGEILPPLAFFSAFEPVVIAVMHHFDFEESGTPGAPCNLEKFKVLVQSIARNKNLRAVKLSAVANFTSSSLSSRIAQNGWATLPTLVSNRIPKFAAVDRHIISIIWHSLSHSR